MIKDYIFSLFPSIFIKYIDLLTKPETVLNNLQNQFQIDKKYRIINKKTTTELKEVNESDAFTNQQKKYYVKKKYLKQYSSIKLKKVNSFLDEKLMDFLDYDIVN